VSAETELAADCRLLAAQLDELERALLAWARS
jgi:hypothetical protein